MSNDLTYKYKKKTKLINTIRFILRKVLVGTKNLS